MTYEKSKLEGYTPTWCSGCGNFPIRIAIINALKELNINTDGVVISYDIGCSGNMNDFIHSYSIHGLHGRSIPIAIGTKLGNHTLPVISVGGDGATLGEGGNHLLHACRGNHDITTIMHDNNVYGLTTGQVSPMSPKGMKSKSTPNGVIEHAANPLILTLTQGATFIGQGFSGNVIELTKIIKAAIEHKGYSFVNVLQPCVSFNKQNTYHYYIKHIKKLPEGYNASDKKSALETCLAIDIEEYYTGILYKVDQPAYHEQVSQLQSSPLAYKDPHNIVNDLVKHYI